MARGGGAGRRLERLSPQAGAGMGGWGSGSADDKTEGEGEPPGEV